MLYEVITLAAGTDVGQDRFDTQFVDDAHALGGNTQLDETLLAFNPETVCLQVGQEATLGSVVRVGTVVTHDRTLTGYLAYSRHVSLLQILLLLEHFHHPAGRVAGHIEGGILYRIVQQRSSKSRAGIDSQPAALGEGDGDAIANHQVVQHPHVDKPESGRDALGHRITSYNVCYTKLLRDPR